MLSTEDMDISFSTVATINDDDTVAEGYSDAVQQRSPITKTIETTTNYDGAPTVYPINVLFSAHILTYT